MSKEVILIKRKKKSIIVKNIFMRKKNLKV